MKDRTLEQIRERDNSYKDIPDHYQGPRDRRYLLKLVDELTKENQSLIAWAIESK